MDEFTVVRTPPGLGVWVLNRVLYGTRMASRCFGKLVAEVSASLKVSRLMGLRSMVERPRVIGPRELVATTRLILGPRELVTTTRLIHVVKRPQMVFLCW